MKNPRAAGVGCDSFLPCLLLLVAHVLSTPARGATASIFQKVTPAYASLLLMLLLLHNLLLIICRDKMSAVSVFATILFALLSCSVNLP